MKFTGLVMAGTKGMKFTGLVMAGLLLALPGVSGQQDEAVAAVKKRGKVVTKARVRARARPPLYSVNAPAREYYAPPAPQTYPSYPAPSVAPSSYATPKPSFQVLASTDGTTLHYVGPIMFGSATRLREALKQNPKATTLVISSPGGEITEGLAMGRLVAMNSLSTHAEATCASACTFVWLEGKSRSIAPDGILGFHESSSYRKSQLAMSQPGLLASGDIVMKRVYGEAGISDAFIDKALKTNSRELWFPTKDEMKAAGLNFTVSSPVQVPRGDGRWATTNAMHAELSKMPVWKIAKQTKPYYYRLATATSWETTILRNEQPAEAVARAQLYRLLLSDLPHYDDQLVEDFAQLEAKIWQSFQPEVFIPDRDSGQSAQRCSAYGEKTYPLKIAASGTLADQQQAIFEKMAATKTPQDFNRQEPTLGEETDADFSVFWAEMMARGETSRGSPTASMCAAPSAIYNTMLTLPKPMRIKAVRTLIRSMVWKPAQY